MMNGPLVSVIVPVYKTEQYLRRCLDSVLSQTYGNLECVCVNDGSPDGSAAILEEYAAKDSRVRVLTQKNQGISCARNNALQNVKGEYLIFLDSDDSIHPQLLEICVYQAVRDGADLVVYGLSHSYRNMNKMFHILGLSDFKPRHKKFVKEKVKSVFTDNIFAYATERSHEKLEGIDNRYRVKHCRVCLSLYRTSAIRDVRFCPGIRYEDFPWWGEALLHIKTATINNLPLYYYYPTRTSFIISSGNREKVEYLEKAIAVAEKVFENAGTPEQKKIWEDRFIAPFRNRLNKKRKKYGEN